MILVSMSLQARNKWEAGDKEIRDLWAKMNSWVYAGFDETYKALGVSFDKIYYESNTYIEGKKKITGIIKWKLFLKNSSMAYSLYGNRLFKKMEKS